jgi:hypothetical protein
MKNSSSGFVFIARSIGAVTENIDSVSPDINPTKAGPAKKVDNIFPNLVWYRQTARLKAMASGAIVKNHVFLSGSGNLRRSNIEYIL